MRQVSVVSEMTNMKDIEPIYLHPHVAANEPVTLHEGHVVLREGGNTAEGTGRLALRFFPSTGLHLEAEIASGTAPAAGATAQLDIAGDVTDALVHSARMEFHDGKRSSRIEAFISHFETGAAEGLASVGFQVLNFPDFMTPGTKPAPVYGFPPKVAELRAGD